MFILKGKKKHTYTLILLNSSIIKNIKQLLNNASMLDYYYKYKEEVFCWKSIKYK